MSAHFYADNIPPAIRELADQMAVGIDIGEFASGDQLAQLDRDRTEGSARSNLCDAEHHTIHFIFL